MREVNDVVGTEFLVQNSVMLLYSWMCAAVNSLDQTDLLLGGSARVPPHQ